MICDLNGSLGSRQFLYNLHSAQRSSIFLYINHTTHNSLIRSDEGLTLETSASESLYGGQFTLSTQLIKPNYPVSSIANQRMTFMTEQ